MRVSVGVCKSVCMSVCMSMLKCDRDSERRVRVCAEVQKDILLAKKIHTTRETKEVASVTLQLHILYEHTPYTYT